jgi:hypothetical protein
MRRGEKIKDRFISDASRGGGIAEGGFIARDSLNAGSMRQRGSAEETMDWVIFDIFQRYLRKCWLLTRLSPIVGLR